MSTRIAADPVDVSPDRRPGPAPLALALAIAGLGLGFIAWDLFTAGGIVFGPPLAIAAVVTGLLARRSAAGGARRRQDRGPCVPPRGTRSAT